MFEEPFNVLTRLIASELFGLTNRNGKGSNKEICLTEEEPSNIISDTYTDMMKHITSNADNKYGHNLSTNEHNADSLKKGYCFAYVNDAFPSQSGINIISYTRPDTRIVLDSW